MRKGREWIDVRRMSLGLTFQKRELGYCKLSYRTNCHTSWVIPKSKACHSVAELRFEPMVLFLLRRIWSPYPSTPSLQHYASVNCKEFGCRCQQLWLLKSIVYNSTVVHICEVPSLYCKISKLLVIANITWMFCEELLYHMDYGTGTRTKMCTCSTRIQLVFLGHFLTHD